MPDFNSLISKPSSLSTLPTPLYGLPMVAVLSTALLAVFVVSQLLATALFAPMVLAKGKLTLAESVLLGGTNGTVVSLAAIATLLAVFLAIWLLIRVKNGSYSDYLGLRGFGWGQLLGFSILLLLLNGIINLVTIWLDREPMLFMDELAISAHPLWLLVLAIVFVVPIYEELIFRGFIWSGIAGTKLGIWGASIITSLIFAVIHVQYGAVEMALIIALAMLFSYARAVSGSLLLPMVLHMMNNGFAMWQYLG